LTRWQGFRQLPIRRKLLALVLLPLVVVLPMLGLVLRIDRDIRIPSPNRSQAS
jgi:hypothetical protein